MNNSKVYREIVQAGLDSRAAERVEATLEKQARLLRLIINDNHKLGAAARHNDGYAQVDEKTRIAMYAQAAQCPQNKAKAEKVPEVKADAVPLTRREQEAAECRAWYKFMALVFGPLLVAGMLVSIAGTAPIAIPLLILMAAYTVLILLTAIKAFFPKPSISQIKTVAARILFAERS